MIAREAALIYLGNELLTCCLEQNWRRNFVQGGVMGVEQDICKNGTNVPLMLSLSSKRFRDILGIIEYEQYVWILF